MTFATTSDSRPVTGARRPVLPAELLAEVLRRDFGIAAAAQTPLGGEVDLNLRVDDEQGRPHFVRASRAEPGSADIAWQNALLRHLEATVPELPVPRLVPTLTGADGVDLVHDGAAFTVRVLSWVPGRTLADTAEHPPALLTALGRIAGQLNLGLSGMARPEGGLPPHDWDMRRAAEVVGEPGDIVTDPSDLADVRRIMAWYARIHPVLAELPHGVVHQDLNDANVLALDGEISGVVDVGDALYSIRVAEVAIAAGYAMVRKADPLAAAAHVVAGFHSVVPLTAEEIAAIYPLAAARLCMNAVTWNRRVAESGSEYGRTRSRHTWPTIRMLAQVPPDAAEAVFRVACGLPDHRPTAPAEELAAAVERGFAGAGNIVALDARPASELYDDVDWTDAAALRAAVTTKLAGRPGVLGHLEASLAWSARRRPGSAEPATVRVGSTVLLPAGTEVAAPANGLVVRAGSPLVVRHGEVFSCWWSLDAAVEPGDPVTAGQVLGTVAEGDAEPGFGPGVQVQLVRSADVAAWPPPRRVSPSCRRTWRLLTTDPTPELGRLPEELTVDEVVAVRGRRIARSQRNYYARPMNLVRGRDVWFYDEDGLAYLDSLNNVTHVGHAEPRVAAASHRQMRTLNTNSRFVYPQIARYAEKLVATLPEPLEVVFLVCTGSEANDLALRIARQVTGRVDLVNIDGAYHGNTGVVTGISPNRYKGPGGQGAPPTTHEVRMPDRYRGPYGYDDPGAGARYAHDAAEVIARIDADGRRPAAFIAESLMGSGGNIVFPQGYLQGAFAAARKAGALCISDEVQVGVGRLGSWWGFELQGVVPDIVTMGKPLGNGHPLAAVVTTRAIANAFDTGMKYFNTFGGNPVSCAIGETVLDIVERDGLRDNAVKVGGYFAEQLRALAERQPIIGDVRAEGLYLGVELVRDRVTKEPATREAFAVTELTKERGVVVFPNGVHDNVLKIKPPMTFRREHVDTYVEVLDDVLSLPELTLDK